MSQRIQMRPNVVFGASRWWINKATLQICCPPSIVKLGHDNIVILNSGYWQSLPDTNFEQFLCDCVWFSAQRLSCRKTKKLNALVLTVVKATLHRDQCFWNSDHVKTTHQTHFSCLLFTWQWPVGAPETANICQHVFQSGIFLNLTSSFRRCKLANCKACESGYYANANANANANASASHCIPQ